ncbi:segregation/condensation protein A [Patescibacteria group bacterium]|nr:segregation/condensation protein A [Patescibacteria group bacterium]MBU1896017.1 segregation/condensation protein A [Patescibacteria group bacterium]
MEFKLKQFEGPFDLLLSLINEQKLSIGEISIAEVTEQYLNYLDKVIERDTEELADFLVVATKLLLLKSRLLLPQLSMDEDEGASLEDQLKLYQAFVVASKKMNELWLDKQKGAFRIEPPRHTDTFSPPENLTLELVRDSMVQLINRLEPPKALPSTHIDKTVSMKEKVDAIRKMLQNRKSFSFSDLIADNKNRTEIIIGFLALLELVKGQVVGLRQNGSFDDILVDKVI